MFRATTRCVNYTQKFAFNGLRFNSSEAYVNMMATFKQDLRAAMLAKDTIKKNTVRGIMSVLKNKELEGGESDSNEYSLYDALLKMINQREESINEYIKLQRSELAETEKKEQDIIKGYLDKLPVASNEEVDSKVRDIINDLKSKSDKPFPPQKVFAKIPWKTIEAEWKASAGSVKQSIVRVHKEIFP